MFKIKIEDLTHLGGPMGTEYTTSNYEFAETIDSAKRFCEKHYNGSRGPIKWRKSNRGWTSGDLGYIMYSIFPYKAK